MVGIPPSHFLLAETDRGILGWSGKRSLMTQRLCSPSSHQRLDPSGATSPDLRAARQQNLVLRKVGAEVAPPHFAVLRPSPALLLSSGVTTGKSPNLSVSSSVSPLTMGIIIAPLSWVDCKDSMNDACEVFAGLPGIC